MGGGRQGHGQPRGLLRMPSHRRPSGPSRDELQDGAGVRRLDEGVCANFGDKATYTIDAAAFDDARSCGIFCCTFGGFSDYVYKISMTDGKVTSLVKVWNDAYAAKIVAGAAPGA